MTPDPQNNAFQLAADYINQTQQSVFLTGKAGTGKTTFLKYIREHTAKQHAVLAPTGVAAINAGGVTLHSFFQLPFTPYLPQAQRGFSAGAEIVADQHSLLERLRYQKDKRDLLQSLDLLIIDEVSMVRADTLDAIDLILRHYRKRMSQPFGGVQMLFIGDMYQLPPVVPAEEWNILQEHYSSPFFFDSHVVQQLQPLHVELEKIYRQNDQAFIDALNQVRNNQLNSQGLELLHSRYQPGFQPSSSDHFITLTTHNRKADVINEAGLAGLPGTASSYGAEVEGEFNERSYPADMQLQLKPGAQVMFLKNDLEKPRKFFNGKIGVVENMYADKITVRCPDLEMAVEVKREEWRNVQYLLNRQEQKIEEKELGVFRQFPLRLAWAITIHKSQGLTFEKAIIDAGSAFAPGQVYVALSRCTNLQGMVLRSTIQSGAVFTDPRIVAFAGKHQPLVEMSSELLSAKHQYQSSQLVAAFSPKNLAAQALQIQKVLNDHQGSFNAEALPWVEALIADCGQLEATAGKFQLQLGPLLQMPELPEANTALQERVKKAAAWFAAELEKMLVSIKNQPAVTDSRENAVVFEDALGRLYRQLMEWKQLVDACREGFEITRLLKARSKVNIGSVIGLAYAGSSRRQQNTDSPHPELFGRLRQLRDDICRPKNTPIYMVAGSNTLHEMARYLPLTLHELNQITGFGPAKIKLYGQAFLDLIADYAAENNLQSQMHEKEAKPERKTAVAKAAKQQKAETPPKVKTQELSYALWQQGRSVEEVAKERNLQPATIESHLAEYVLKGEMPMNVLVAPVLFSQICQALETSGSAELSPAKALLGDAASFSQIRLVRDWLKQQDEISPSSAS